MKFTLINCWLIQSEVFDSDIFKDKPFDFQIIKKGILKNGYRAFLVDDKQKIEQSSWYKDFIIANEVRVYIEGSGIYKVVNIDLSDNEIYFERLNVPIGYKPWIFFCWQSDFNPSRSHIKEALKEIIAEINETRKPNQILELVESTRNEDGASDIPEAILGNIDKSLLFVADITNVALVKKFESEDSSEDKPYPNANVVFEMSYALIKKAKDQIVLIKKPRDDFKNDVVPFDFILKKRLMYDKPAKLKDELKKIIIAFLERKNYISQQ
jgi:hypothetical protein